MNAVRLVKKNGDHVMPLKPHPTDPDKMVYVSRQYDLPPKRELTDEEIMEIYNDQANRDFQLRSDPFKFARAILKKASEK